MSKSIKAREEWVQQAFMGIMKGLREKGGKVATEKVGELRPRPTGKPTAK